eukprot:4186190-Prymnesium_polylepis.1
MPQGAAFRFVPVAGLKGGLTAFPAICPCVLRLGCRLFVCFAFGVSRVERARPGRAGEEPQASDPA